MKTTAAILVETGAPLELVDLETPALKTGQTLVEIAYSGVCHTQVLECRGKRGEDKFLPHCLGHEGTGFVLEAGPGCSRVKSGDRVILSWIKGPGGDVPGTVYDWGGKRVNAGGITTFQRHAIISENRLTLLPQDLGMRESALLGCALPTGLGAVFNVARPRPGQSLVVFGAGGIGLCAVMGATMSGCCPVIAVDLLPEKLDLARRVGATHCVDAREENVLEQVRGICPGGVDFAIEATGRPQVMQQALASVRQQGGAAVVVGNAPDGEMVALNPRELNMGKSLLGTWGGDSVPDRDYPRYCRLLASGRLDVAPLLGEDYPLSAINRAIDDLEAGRSARPLIKM